MNTELHPPLVDGRKWMGQLMSTPTVNRHVRFFFDL